MRLKLLLLFLLAFTAGCGGEKSPEYVYEPEFNIIDIDCDRVVQSAVLGDNIYFVSETYDEETGNSSSELGVINGINAEYKKLPGDNSLLINNMAVLNENHLVLFGSNQEYEQLIAIADHNGNITKRAKLVELGVMDQEGYINYFTADGKNNIYILDENNRAFILDDNLQIKSDFTINDEISNIFSTGEGDVYVQTGFDSFEVKRIDINSKTTAAGNMPRFNIYGNNYKPAAVSGTVLNDYEGMYHMNFEDGTMDKLFSMVEMNIVRNDVNTVGQLQTGDYFVITTSTQQGFEETALIKVKKVPAAEAKKVNHIKYGCLYLSGDMERQLVHFNRTHSDIQISTTEYMNITEYTEQAVNDALNKFNNDIISGNSVDIIDLSTIPFDRYAKKGLFLDLLPLMERDGMQKEDYLENVLNAYSIGDGVYGMLPSIIISTMSVKKSRFPDMDTWTMEQFMDICKEIPAGNLTDLNNMDYYFDITLYSTMDSFIDWETGKCNFNNSQFTDMLKYAEGFARDEYIYDFEVSTFDKLKKNDICIVSQNIYSISDYKYYLTMFDGDMNIIGYPNPNGKGNRFMPAGSTIPLAISSQSKYKDSAWEFVSGFLKEDYQDKIALEGMYSGFPVMKSSLDKMYKKAMEDNGMQYNENGEQEKMPMGYYSDVDISMPFYEATEQEIDELNRIITSAVPQPFQDEQIRNIIEEEKNAYFSGEKTPEEVAGIIEDRVGLYVSENA